MSPDSEISPPGRILQQKTIRHDLAQKLSPTQWLECAREKAGPYLPQAPTQGSSCRICLSTTVHAPSALFLSTPRG